MLKSSTQRLVPLLAALTLLASACGSRADGAKDSDLGGEETPKSEAQSSLGPKSEKIGSIANPCSADKAEGPLPGGTPGVTADKIRIGVISDKQNPIAPVPTVGIEESVKAFVQFCNDAGGINGRQIELVTYDSELAKVDAVTLQACADDLFAIVGSGSVLDNQGIPSRLGCGLPEIAAYSATSTRAESQLFAQPIPATQSQSFNTGACKYIAKENPSAIKKAAVLYTALPAASSRGKQIKDGCTEHAGFNFVYEKPVAFGEKNFGPIIAEMKAAGVEYFTMVSTVQETTAILKEANVQGLDFDVVDLGQQYYDKAVADEPLMSDAYVLTNTVPFTEADKTPALKLYTDYMSKVGAGEDKITTLGVQAFSAGLLFATAVNSLGNDLSRAGLMTAVKGITSWDGGGLQMTTDPGSGTLNSCFLYMRVEDGKFVRSYPESGFDCDEAYVERSDKKYVG